MREEVCACVKERELGREKERKYVRKGEGEGKIPTFTCFFVRERQL